MSARLPLPASWQYLKQARALVRCRPLVARRMPLDTPPRDAIRLASQPDAGKLGRLRRERDGDDFFVRRLGTLQAVFTALVSQLHSSPTI